MSRKILKKGISSLPYQFQSTSGEGGNVGLEAEAELDAFQDTTATPAAFGMPTPRVDVQGIIDQAQADADAIINQAQARAAAVEREAYEKGLIEGRKTGELMAEQQLQAVLNLYHHGLTQLDRLHHVMLDQWQLDFFDLVLHTAEKVVQGELNTHPGTLLNMVRAAIQGLKERKNLVLYLNQEDHQFMTDLNQKEKQKWLGTQVELEIDPGLPRGSFRIDTPGGELDGRIETQLRQIQETLSQPIEGL